MLYTMRRMRQPRSSIAARRYSFSMLQGRGTGGDTKMSEREWEGSGGGGTSKGVALRAAAVRQHGGVEARFGGYNQRRLRRRGGGRRGGSGLGWGGGDGGGRNVGAAFAHQCGPHLLASLPVLHLGHLASQLPQAVFRLRTPSGGCFAARSAFCMTDPVRRCASDNEPCGLPCICISTPSLRAPLHLTRRSALHPSSLPVERYV